MGGMAQTLSALIDALIADPWRAKVGFSPEVVKAGEDLYAESGKTDNQEKILNEWIRQYQPCIFGKTAAAQKALSYCILSEDDILKGDQYVQDFIAKKHLEWTREGHEGRKSGFILYVVSKRIAEAQPNGQMLEFARRLAALYLNEEEVKTDAIYHDEIYLEIPDRKRSKLRWKAGINYFCAHGDGRWWNDHRIPGGMAFSTNSVGHLAKSTNCLALAVEFEKAMGVDPDKGPAKAVDSLEDALTIAMQTIAKASNAVSGKATELLPLGEGGAELECPFQLPAPLADKNHCRYRGYYHTDYTLPSLYFRADVERGPDVEPFDDLDFTYLFHKHVDNPSYRTMGDGVPIRGTDSSGDIPGGVDKNFRAFEEEIDIDDAPRLVRALETK